MSESENTQILPVLPLKNSVLFPSIIMPLTVGRPISIAATEAALATEEKELLLATQRDATVESPGFADLYGVATRGVIKKVSRQADGTIRLIALGGDRVSLVAQEQEHPFLRIRVKPHPVEGGRTPEVDALHRSILELAGRALALAEPRAPGEIQQLLEGTDDPLRLVYLIASMLSLDVEREQALLEAATQAETLQMMHSYLAHEVQVLELRSKIASQAQTEMTKQQREYILRQQMRAIQNELGESDAGLAEVETLRERLAAIQLPEEIQKEAERELSRLEKIPSASPEYQVIRTYLDYVLELPWTTSTEDQLDLPRARRVLDEDHFDLTEVKERILEQLGVLKLNPDAKAPILCFVGPPGVGKTSLGQSIARALGRKFERMSLGGMHDEAELRGHRRTYIGALPGRIIQALRRAASNNPVLMLDEVDKLGRDFRGDPASALLEILDPEQNRTFRDNYLDLPFDLSRTFFITTANTLDTIPRPLLDRMEVLRLMGYSEEEKIAIARKYLLPRQTRQTGLREEQFNLPDETLRAIIARYTREAGLRQLERQIGRVARRIALRFAEGNDGDTVAVRPDDLADFLGPEPFSPEELRKEMPAGVATGLAWTEGGGEVLYIEATLLPGGRDLTITGQIGDIMRESARAAQSYIWSHAEELGIDPAMFRRSGLHLHVPAGAIPKDGPSAGIAIATAMASLYMKAPARADTAMTGEITLTGLVLPVGGIKAKLLAARRAGVRRVVIPRANQKDLRELPDAVRQDLEILTADRIQDVLAATLPGIAERWTTARPV